jgi:ankyrin repeat protein
MNLIAANSNLNPKQIQNIYEDLKVRKSVFQGKDLKLVGGIVNTFEKLVNSVKKLAKEVQVQVHYGASRKVLKKVLANQVSNNITRVLENFEQKKQEINAKEDLDKAAALIKLTELLEQDLKACEASVNLFKGSQEKAAPVVEAFRKKREDVSSVKTAAQDSLQSAAIRKLTQAGSISEVEELEAHLEKLRAAEGVDLHFLESIKPIMGTKKEELTAQAALNSYDAVWKAYQENLQAIANEKSEALDQAVNTLKAIDQAKQKLHASRTSAQPFADSKAGKTCLQVLETKLAALDTAQTENKEHVKTLLAARVKTASLQELHSLVSQLKAAEGLMDAASIAQVENALQFKIEELRAVQRLQAEEAANKQLEAQRVAKEQDLAALQQAIDQSRFTEVKTLIKDKKLINERLPNGLLPLSFALFRENAEMIQWMLLPIQGADLNLRDAESFTPFDRAAQMKNTAVAAQIFKRAAADSIKQSNEANRELAETVEKLKKGLEQFIEHNAEVVKKGLETQIKAAVEAHTQFKDEPQQVKDEIVQKNIAAKLGNVDIKTFLKNRFNQIIAAGGHLNYPRKGHNQWLLHSIKTGDVKQFIRLVLNGANIVTGNPETGASLLHEAVLHDRKEIALILLIMRFPHQYGGSDHGNLPIGTALDLAKKNGKEKLVKLLTDWEQKDNSSALEKDFDQLQKLIDECKQEQSKLSPELLEQRKKIATYQSYGHQPWLEIAIQHDRLESFIELHLLGASITTQSRPPAEELYPNPESYAQKYAQMKKSLWAELETMQQDPAIVNTLPLDKKFGIGQSLLHLAAEKGATKIVRYLLSQGLDPNQGDTEGNLPAELAFRNGHFEAGMLILSKNSIPLLQKALRNPNEVAKAVELLAGAACDRDPLQVNSEELLSLGVTAMYMLTSPAFLMMMVTKYPASIGVLNFMGGYGQYIFGALGVYILGNTALRILKGASRSFQKEEYPLSQWIQSIGHYLYEGQTIELLTNAKYPLMMTASRVVGLYHNIVTVPQKAELLKKHYATRPRQTVLKGAVTALNIGASAFHLYSLCSRMYSDLFPAKPPKLPAKVDECKKVDPQKYYAHEDFAAMERRFAEDGFKGLDPLDPNCPQHAQILFGVKPGDLPNTFYNATGDNLVRPKHLYNDLAMAWHTDKTKLFEQQLVTLQRAHHTMQKVKVFHKEEIPLLTAEKNTESWKSLLSPYAELCKTTARIGAVFLLNKMPAVRRKFYSNEVKLASLFGPLTWGWSKRNTL